MRDRGSGRASLRVPLRPLRESGVGEGGRARRPPPGEVFGNVSGLRRTDSAACGSPDGLAPPRKPRPPPPRRRRSSETSPRGAASCRTRLAPALAPVRRWGRGATGRAASFAGWFHADSSFGERSLRARGGFQEASLRLFDVLPPPSPRPSRPSAKPPTVPTKASSAARNHSDGFRATPETAAPAGCRSPRPHATRSSFS